MRFFIEVSYKGEKYAGSQIQENAISIQSILEEKIKLLTKHAIRLVGSSRTDAGVHAYQNFYHTDTDVLLSELSLKSLNAILPHDIAIHRIVQVPPHIHCRYDAQSRSYIYKITTSKNPFLYGDAYYYPIPFSYEILQTTSAIIVEQQNFISFSKKNTQVQHFGCLIHHSEWILDKEQSILLFHIEANRFLRGMVRALVATQLHVASGKLDITQFRKLFSEPHIATANFAAPPEGLYLKKITYPFPIG